MAAIDKTLSKHLAGPDSDPAFLDILSIMPNPDKIICNRPNEEEIYRAIAADAHVFSNILSRRSAVLAKRVEVSSGDGDDRAKDAAELGRTALQQIDMRSFVAGILNAPLHGRSFLEVIWKKNDGLLLPDEVRIRPLRRFVYTPNDKLRLLTKKSPIYGEPVPDYKFIATRNYPTDDNPYGEAALTRCFWPVTFKKSGFKFWIILAEKYGIPWAVGKAPRGTPVKEREKLLDSLEQMIADAVAVISGDEDIEIFEHKAESSAAVHEQLIGACNAECSKAILGQTLSTELGDRGSFAAVAGHLEVRSDIVEDDCRLVETAIETLIGWTVELNMGPTVEIPSAELASESEPPKDWAETLDIARNFMKIPTPWAHERLNIPMKEEEDEETLPATPAGAGGFSAFAADPTDGLVDPPVAGTAADIERFQKLVIKAAAASENYQEFLLAMGRIYEDWPAKEVEKALAEAGFNAAAFGAWEASKE